MGLNSVEFARFLVEDGAGYIHGEVRYVPEYPDLVDNSLDTIKAALTTKSTLWEYEREWRFVSHPCTDREVTLPDGIIVEVTLGWKMPERDRHEVIMVVRQKNPSIRLYQAGPHRDRFALTRVELKY